MSGNFPSWVEWKMLQSKPSKKLSAQANDQACSNSSIFTSFINLNWMVFKIVVKSKIDLWTLNQPASSRPYLKLSFIKLFTELYYMDFGNIAPMLSNSQQWCMCTLRQQTIKLIHSLQPPLPSSIDSILYLNFRYGIQTTLKKCLLTN